MTNKFQNMSAYDIAEDIYENADTAGVDAAFEDLKSAAPAFRKEAVDALEKIIIKDLGGLADDYKMFGPVPEWFMADTVEDAASLADTQSCCQMLLHISQIKGNEAHPVTKELVKRSLSTLSDAAYNNYSKLETVVVKAYIKATAPPAITNPFRKPKAPRM